MRVPRRAGAGAARRRGRRPVVPVGTQVRAQGGPPLYVDRGFDERKDEAVEAAAAAAEFDRLLAAAGGRGGSAPFVELVARIKRFQDEHAASDAVPYREALTLVRTRAAAAAKGNLPAAPLPDDDAPAKGLVEGQPAPDVSAADWTGRGETVRLIKLGRRPGLIAYYQPSRTTAGDVLALAQDVAAKYRTKVFVLPLAVGDKDAALKQREELNIKVPIYDGRDAYPVHEVEATPVLAVLDADGVVRKVIRGWTDDAPKAVLRELEKWVR